MVPERWMRRTRGYELLWPAIRIWCSSYERLTVRSFAGRSNGHRSSGYEGRARASAAFAGFGVSHPNEADTAALLAELHRAGVRFIVVGGAAAQIHGST